MGREKSVQAMIKKNHENKLKRKVVLGCEEKRIELDITYGELEEYRKTHPVCEMCGKQETCITFTGKTGRETPNKLSIDHDNKTGKFRGLLCRRCNCQFGWYELNKDKIENYLKSRSIV